MTPGLETFVQSSIQNFEATLALVKDLEPGKSGSTNSALTPLDTAIDYAIRAGGKRVRPCLVYTAGHAIYDTGCPTARMDDAACAIELIHTCFLMHDDLPAMDDDLRRGKPILHKAYDEGSAILVGDGLQAWMFELIAGAPDLREMKKDLIINALGRASGFHCMVDGRFIGISSAGEDLTLDQLQSMHALKTGALMRAALDEYGTHIDLAFQVVCDVLDVEGDTAILGKTQGKDGEANTPT